MLNQSTSFEIEIPFQKADVLIKFLDLAYHVPPLGPYFVLSRYIIVLYRPTTILRYHFFSRPNWITSILWLSSPLLLWSAYLSLHNKMILACIWPCSLPQKSPPSLSPDKWVSSAYCNLMNVCRPSLVVLIVILHALLSWSYCWDSLLPIQITVGTMGCFISRFTCMQYLFLAPHWERLVFWLTVATLLSMRSVYSQTLEALALPINITNLSCHMSLQSPTSKGTRSLWSFYFGK